MSSPDPTYIADNRRHAERILTILEDRRLLQDRHNIEDAEFCRRSAHELRGLLGAQMLTIEAGGYLVDVLRDVRRACTIFVDAAGRDAVNFHHDHQLFVHHLQALRITVAQRVRRIVDEFHLNASPEIQQIMTHLP